VEHLDDVMVCGLAVLGIIIEENTKWHHHVLHGKPENASFIGEEFVKRSDQRRRQTQFKDNTDKKTQILTLQFLYR
jgi:hypothetical protein